MSVTKDIESLLPHRKPFLFVDEIVSADDEGSVSTSKFTDEDYSNYVPEEKTEDKQEEEENSFGIDEDKFEDK